jgi:NAD(P)-dependent dehydrogenase (short-subunit alcohol dehydrogenase family)
MTAASSERTRPVPIGSTVPVAEFDTPFVLDPAQLEPLADRAHQRGRLTGPLAGKVALVTGAGRGIGRALSLGLVDAGARVAILARSQDELDEVAGAMRERGGTALVIAADLGDPGQLADAASRALGQFAAVDLLINNAAVVWPLGPTSIVDPADWASAMAINVTAPVTLTRALLPAMLERGFGRIVNVSSGVAAHPAAMIGGNAYAATKAALEAHTLNLAAELTGSGVTVNVFRPGTVDTTMQAWIRGQPPERIGAALHARFTRAYEQGSLITPEQSAQALLEHLLGNRTGEIWSVTAA